MKIKNLEKKLIILGLFIISFLILMITSKSSFLYPFNDWGDANAFFTVGKSLFNGKVIFRDIFEQKGPLLYLIYGIGYLISNQTFLGIFIIEVISSTIFSYYIYKIITLYLDEKNAYIIIPIFLSLLYSSQSFSSGGSCEELCLPFLSYTVYELLLYCRNKDISYKKIYLVGFVTGCIFLIKYTMLGFGFAFAFYLFFSSLFDKKYKNAFIFSFIFLLGMITPIIPWLIYFALNNAVYDFFNAYIFINAFSYGVNDSSIFQRLFNCIYHFLRNLRGTGIHIFIIFFGIILYIFNKKTILREKLALISLIFFSILFTYIGGTYLYYYVFPLVSFILFAFIGFFLFFKTKIKINKFIYIISICLSLSISYMISSNTRFIGVSKNDLPQYQFKKIIMEKDNPTILNYGGLDMGFYTVTGIVPNTKYFEKLNFKYDKFPNNVDSLNNYIKNREVDFVIFIKSDNPNYPISEYLEINYERVMEYTKNSKYEYHDYYLYKLRSE